MSTTHTIPAADVIESSPAQFAVEVFQTVTHNLATTDKKGNRVSFERSIAFASKDERLKLSTIVYEKQVNNGIYGPLLNDALASGLLSKSQREVAEALMVGSTRNPSKVTALAMCTMILNINAGKTLKGQKLFYGQLIRALSDALAE